MKWVLNVFRAFMLYVLYVVTSWVMLDEERLGEVTPTFASPEDEQKWDELVGEKVC